MTNLASQVVDINYGAGYYAESPAQCLAGIDNRLDDPRFEVGFQLRAVTLVHQSPDDTVRVPFPAHNLHGRHPSNNTHYYLPRLNITQSL